MDSIAPILLDWYARNGRDLPWRHTCDPYLIWLSEVILQQTRVGQGLDYYLRFAARFPNVETLAAASEDEVLKLWQGLGYYSRARNLHAAAKQIVEHYHGVFPLAYDDLRALRGVGEYTAAAVSSAACGAPHAVVDGNVCRVLSRLFDIAEPVDTASGKRVLAELAQAQLDTRSAGRYNQAIMDFGALQCTPVRPACSDCPLAERCLALAAGSVAQRPVKRVRMAARKRWFNYLHITCDGKTLLRRRGEGDIWQGLYEFPMIETTGEEDFARLMCHDDFAAWVGDHWALMRTTSMPPHKLSHQTIHSIFYHIEAEVPDHSLVVASVDDYAVPRLLERYLSRK